MKKTSPLMDDIVNNSDFLKVLNRFKSSTGKSILFGNQVRKLTAREVDLLKSLGNDSDNWDRIRVVQSFQPHFIRNSRFYGDCVLGEYSGEKACVEDNTVLPTGIYNSTLIHTEAGNNCLIASAALISRWIIESGCIVFNTGSLTGHPDSTFGNGISIPVGIETGGRDVLSFAGLSFSMASASAMQRHNKSVLSEYNKSVKDFVKSCQFSFGILIAGSVVRHIPKMINTFVDSCVLIDGAQLIENATLLGSMEEPTVVSHGAMVKNSIVQHGCTVTSMSIVENSVLNGHVHVERHGKVFHSIIGPNSGVAEGEITSSLVGPFTGFHHQALLIGALWPGGKGNVGYGANVGSNHTSKAPDQEIFCGEGCFFGLGVNIKFPTDFSEAPYTIVATAVDTLPQKVSFPFSLINKPSRNLPDVSPALNEIIPAWVLSSNIYAVRRNELKFKQRNRSEKTDFQFETFRPEIVDLMVSARARLGSVKEKKDVYLEQDIHGLGKNYLLSRYLKRAVETYSFYIEYYILNRLLKKMKSIREKIDPDRLLNSTHQDAEWEHARRLFQKEGFQKRSLTESLERLAVIQERIALNTLRSKEMDDGRGARIIPDYSDIHTPAEKDPFVLETRAETKKIRAEIKDLLQQLKVK